MSGTIYAGTGAVGFELVIPCSGEPLNSRVHENDESLTVFSNFCDNCSVFTDSQALCVPGGEDTLPCLTA